MVVLFNILYIRKILIYDKFWLENGVNQMKLNIAVDVKKGWISNFTQLKLFMVLELNAGSNIAKDILRKPKEGKLLCIYPLIKYVFIY